MNASAQPGPLTLGLFEKRCDGDDCLMELARRRFEQAGMGAEMHAGTPEQLDWELRFRPATAAQVMVHLPRDLNLTQDSHRRRILDLAARGAGRVRGLVVHDHPDLAARAEEYLRGAAALNAGLLQLGSGPMVFVEYAAGLEPEAFTQFFGAIRGLDRISACVDIGHVGIRQSQRAYARAHPGEDVCSLKSRPAGLPPLMADIEAAVHAAVPEVLGVIRAITSLGKPVHYHLHDGHPLSAFSPYGVADHLSFLTTIPIGFEWRGRSVLAPLFGPDGLARIVDQALAGIDAGQVSFTLEIHPASGRLALGDASPMFDHWRDKTNAERMNHWLALLGENHGLLRHAIAEAQSAACAGPTSI